MVDRHLVAVLAHLTISPTILDRIIVAQAEDEQPGQSFSQGTYVVLIRGEDGLYRMGGRL